MAISKSPKKFFCDEDRLACALKQAEITESMQADSPSRDTRRAAAELAISLGMVRMFQCKTSVVDDDELLDLKLAKIATDGIRELAAEGIVQLESISECWDKMETDLERELAVVSVLESRLELQAAAAAVEDTRQDLADGGVKDAHFDAALSLLNTMRSRFDSALLVNEEMISQACQTHWLDHVDLALPENAWQPRPWWLTSWIQEVHRRQAKEAGEFERWLERNTMVLTPTQNKLNLLTQKSNTPGEQIDLAIAADDSETRPYKTLFELNHQNDAGTIKLEVKIQPSFGEIALGQIPATAKALLVLTVRQAIQADPDLSKAPDRSYRVRFGPIVDEAKCKASKTDPEFIGTVGDKFHPWSDVRHALVGGVCSDAFVWRKS